VPDRVTPERPRSPGPPAHLGHQVVIRPVVAAVGVVQEQRSQYPGGILSRRGYRVLGLFWLGHRATTTACQPSAGSAAIMSVSPSLGLHTTASVEAR
jgi:hypothetical protein